MTKTLAYATQGPKEKLEPFHFDRRDLKDLDIQIESLFCGVCHSDIHQARDEWGGSTYPMVPGHEVVGKVIKVGSKVTRFKAGDLVGVGCMVDSCQKCESCLEHTEQFCLNGASMTYNGVEQDKKTRTQGGYSSQMIVTEKFALKIDPTQNLAAVAPLLCAGITTYSPLKHWNIGPGKKVGIVGLGGLGHMGVKIAASMGAEVTVFTTSEKKREDAKRLGAKHVIISKNESEMEAAQGQFHFILNTVSAPHDINALTACLKRDGTMVLVGLPDKAPELEAGNLIMGRRSISGSLIGGIKETQEMLDYCAKHNIVSDIELIPVQKINEAYDRMIKNDVKYRFVIDLKSLG